MQRPPAPAFAKVEVATYPGRVLLWSAPLASSASGADQRRLGESPDPATAQRQGYITTGSFAALVAETTTTTTAVPVSASAPSRLPAGFAKPIRLLGVIVSPAMCRGAVLTRIFSIFRQRLNQLHSYIMAPRVSTATYPLPTPPSTDEVVFFLRFLNHGLYTTMCARGDRCDSAAHVMAELLVTLKCLSPVEWPTVPAGSTAADTTVLQLDVRWSIVEALCRYETLVNNDASGEGTGSNLGGGGGGGGRPSASSSDKRVANADWGIQRVIHDMLELCIRQRKQLATPSPFAAAASWRGGNGVLIAAVAANSTSSTSTNSKPTTTTSAIPLPAFQPVQETLLLMLCICKHRGEQRLGGKNDQLWADALRGVMGDYAGARAKPKQRAEVFRAVWLVLKVLQDVAETGATHELAVAVPSSLISELLKYWTDHTAVLNDFPLHRLLQQCVRLSQTFGFHKKVLHHFWKQFRVTRQIDHLSDEERLGQTPFLDEAPYLLGVDGENSSARQRRNKHGRFAAGTAFHVYLQLVLVQLRKASVKEATDFLVHLIQNFPMSPRAVHAESPPAADASGLGRTHASQSHLGSILLVVCHAVLTAAKEGEGEGGGRDGGGAKRNGTPVASSTSRTIPPPPASPPTTSKFEAALAMKHMIKRLDFSASDAEARELYLKQSFQMLELFQRHSIDAAELAAAIARCFQILVAEVAAGCGSSKIPPAKVAQAVSAREMLKANIKKAAIILYNGEVPRQHGLRCSEGELLGSVVAKGSSTNVSGGMSGLLGVLATSTGNENLQKSAAFVLGQTLALIQSRNKQRTEEKIANAKAEEEDQEAALQVAAAAAAAAAAELEEIADATAAAALIAAEHADADIEGNDNLADEDMQNSEDLDSILAGIDVDFGELADQQQQRPQQHSDVVGRGCSRASPVAPPGRSSGSADCGGNNGASEDADADSSNIAATAAATNATQAAPTRQLAEPKQLPDNVLEAIAFALPNVLTKLVKSRYARQSISRITRKLWTLCVECLGRCTLALNAAAEANQRTDLYSKLEKHIMYGSTAPLYKDSAYEQRQEPVKLLALVAAADVGHKLERKSELSNVWLLAMLDSHSDDADLQYLTMLLRQTTKYDCPEWDAVDNTVAERASAASSLQPLRMLALGRDGELTASTNDAVRSSRTHSGETGSASGGRSLEYAARLEQLKLFVRRAVKLGDVHQALINLRTCIDVCRRDSMHDGQYRNYINGALTIVLRDCAPQLYRNVQGVQDSAANRKYFFPRLLEDTLAVSAEALGLLPSLLAALARLKFSTDSYLLRMLKREIFGQLFERFSYAPKSCSCPGIATVQLHLHHDPLEKLKQIHGVAQTFASALQAAVEEDGSGDGSGNVGGGSISHLRRFVLVTLVQQYFGAAAATHPGYPCLLQLSTQFVKLLNSYTVAACRPPPRKRELAESSNAVAGSASGGSSRGKVLPVPVSMLSQSVAIRESELYILLAPLLETICGHGQVMRLGPGKASRGDAYSALKSTLTSLRDIWIAQGVHGPVTSQRREALRTAAKVLGMHCVVDLFEASDPTPNQRQDAARDKLLPTSNDVLAEVRKLKAEIRSSVTHPMRNGNSGSVWAQFSANPPAIAMCDCDGPRTDAPRRTTTASISKIRGSVAQQALAALLQIATLLPETAAEVASALPQLHQVGTFRTARGTLRAHQSYRAFLANVGPAGMPYLHVLNPASKGVVEMMREGRL